MSFSRTLLLVQLYVHTALHKAITKREWCLVKECPLDIGIFSRMFAGFVEPILLHSVGIQFQSIHQNVFVTSQS